MSAVAGHSSPGALGTTITRPHDLHVPLRPASAADTTISLPHWHRSRIRPTATTFTFAVPRFGRRDPARPGAAWWTDSIDRGSSPGTFGKALGSNVSAFTPWSTGGAEGAPR